MIQLLLLLTLFCSNAWADVSSPIEFRTVTGDVSGFPYQVKFSDGSVVDNGDGTFTITTNSGLSSPVAIAEGGTGQTSRQAAIDALTNVSATSTGYVLKKDGSGNATFQADSSSVFTNTGNERIYVTIPTNDVVFGSTTPIAGAKMSVVLDENENGVVIKAFAGMTADIVAVLSSDETTMVRISRDGSIVSTGVGDGRIYISGDSTVTTSLAGDLAIDTNAWAAGRGAFQAHDGTSSTFLVGVLASDSPSNGQVPTWNTGGTITWETGSGGSKSPKEYTWPASATLPLEAADSTASLAKDAGTNLDMIPVDFDADTDEGRTVTFRVPSDINSGGTVTFRAYWYSAAATTGDCIWDFRHNSGTADGVDPDVALTTEAASADTTAGTAGQMNFTTWTETVSNLGWVANDLVMGVFYRDANNVSDNLAGDARAVQFDIDIPRA